MTTAVLATVLTVAFSLSAAWAEQPSQVLSGGEIVEVPTHIADESGGTGACCPSGCCPSRQCSSGFWLFPHAGGSYLDSNNDSTGGFTWGAVAGYELQDSMWQPAVSFNLNHVEDGTQSVLTLGAARVADPWSCSHADRITALLAVDQYWDDRFDQDVYLGQMRAMLGYQVLSSLEIGAEYWEPIGSGEDNLFLGGTAFGAMRPTQAVGAYAVRNIGATTLLGRVNYRDRNDTVGLGLNLRRAISDRFSLYTMADYEDRGTWGLSAGVILRFGNRSVPSRSHGPACRRSSDYVVRGQSIVNDSLRFLTMPKSKKKNKDEDPDSPLYNIDVKMYSPAWLPSVSGATPATGGGGGGGGGGGPS